MNCTSIVGELECLCSWDKWIALLFLSEPAVKLFGLGSSLQSVLLLVHWGQVFDATCWARFVAIFLSWMSLVEALGAHCWIHPVLSKQKLLLLMITIQNLIFVLYSWQVGLLLRTFTLPHCCEETGGALLVLLGRTEDDATDGIFGIHGERWQILRNPWPLQWKRHGCFKPALLYWLVNISGLRGCCRAVGESAVWVTQGYQDVWRYQERLSPVPWFSRIQRARLLQIIWTQEAGDQSSVVQQFSKHVIFIKKWSEPDVIEPFSKHPYTVLT